VPHEPDPATIVNLRKNPHAAALPISGGQKVAGSNPVVPTAVESPLVLVIVLGQRAFLIPCGGRGVDLDCGGMGTICGPSVDTARSFEATHAVHGALYPGVALVGLGTGSGWWLRWLWSCGEVRPRTARPEETSFLA
jgi:hypothetical protein